MSNEEHVLSDDEIDAIQQAYIQRLMPGARIFARDIERAVLALLPAASEPLDTLTISIDFDDGVTEEIEVHATGKMLGRLNVWLDRKRGKFHEAAASEAEPVGWVSRQAFDQMAENDNQIEVFPSSESLTDEYPAAHPMPVYAAPAIRNSRIAGDGEAEPVQVSDEALIAHWILAGGAFHGPNVETGSMPQDKLLPFLRRLLAAPPEKQASHSEGDAEKLPVKYYKDGGTTHAVYGSSSISYVETLRARFTVPHSLTVAQGDEQQAFEAAWPRIQQAGDSDGWLGIACAAWNERAGLAQGDAGEERQRVGEAITNFLAGHVENGALEFDVFDSRNIDALLDAIDAARALPT